MVITAADDTAAGRGDHPPAGCESTTLLVVQKKVERILTGT
jgi:hypothetical protein